MGICPGVVGKIKVSVDFDESGGGQDPFLLRFYPFVQVTI